MRRAPQNSQELNSIQFNYPSEVSSHVKVCPFVPDQHINCPALVNSLGWSNKLTREAYGFRAFYLPLILSNACSRAWRTCTEPQNISLYWIFSQHIFYMQFVMIVLHHMPVQSRLVWSLFTIAISIQNIKKSAVQCHRSGIQETLGTICMHFF